MRAAITAHDIGTVFRLARELAGISYSKIAAECDIKPERVGTPARGKGSVTSFEKIARVADALRIPGRMLGLAPRIWEKSEPVPARDRTSEEDDSPVERRRFLRAGTGAGLAATLPELSRPTAGRRLGSELPNQLRRRTARLRRLDQVLGGGDTYRVYLGEHQATKALLRDSTYAEQTRRDLLSVLAEQAQQAGWAAFDGGRAADARGLYEESHSAATEAGDTDLTAGEVEQAATTAVRALDLAHGVASVRPRARLAPLLQRLDAHRGLPAVDTVLEKAAAV
ncbi:hypothetical protein [Streptomyces sp. NPDC021224]|uniref:hypothetical protein n=1 Tax=unclassified Streptomyces TaxID=2593676 RepID=UPI0037B49CD7